MGSQVAIKCIHLPKVLGRSMGKDYRHLESYGMNPNVTDEDGIMRDPTFDERSKEIIKVRMIPKRIKPLVLVIIIENSPPGQERSNSGAEKDERKDGEALNF